MKEIKEFKNKSINTISKRLSVGEWHGYHTIGNPTEHADGSITVQYARTHGDATYVITYNKNYRCISAFAK